MLFQEIAMLAMISEARPAVAKRVNSVGNEYHSSLRRRNSSLFVNVYSVLMGS